MTVPKEIMKELQLQPGIEVQVKSRGDVFVVSPKKKKLAHDVDAKFAKLVEEFIDEHEDVLRELAKR